MILQRKVSGENLVNRCISDDLEYGQHSDSYGDPGLTRTTDPLLRRPIPGFLPTFRKPIDSLATPILSRVSRRFRPLTSSSQKQRFRHVSGEQLVNFPVSFAYEFSRVFGATAPIDSPSSHSSSPNSTRPSQEEARRG